MIIKLQCLNVIMKFSEIMFEKLQNFVTINIIIINTLNKLHNIEYCFDMKNVFVIWSSTLFFMSKFHLDKYNFTDTLEFEMGSEHGSQITLRGYLDTLYINSIK